MGAAFAVLRDNFGRFEAGGPGGSSVGIEGCPYVKGDEGRTASAIEAEGA